MADSCDVPAQVRVSVSNSVAELRLTEEAVLCDIQSGKDVEVLLEDIIGVQVEEPESDQSCILTVHYYPVVSRLNKRVQRKQCQMPVQFDWKESSEENIRDALAWKDKILLQTERTVLQSFECREFQNGKDSALEQEWRPKRFLVFLNPFAGDGNGEYKFNSTVRPMFDLAGIRYTVKVTEHQNHAFDLIQELDLSQYNGIVIASGDGLLHEVVNGIMKRPDWETSIKIPLGMLPIGSGNALAASTLYEAKEEFSLEAAAFQIIRGGVTPLDLAAVQACDGRQRYMCLLAGWGMVADVDINSESMRMLGESRFVIMLFKSILWRKVYSGRLSYLPWDASLEPVTRNIPSSAMHTNRATEFPTNDLKPSSSSSSSSSLHEPTAPRTDLLVPLEDELPDTWRTLPDEDFLSMSVLMVPLVTSSVFGHPDLKIGCGKICLMYLKGSTSRWGALKVAVNSMSGSHVQMEEVVVINAKAFRIEPMNGGIMTVDGEKLETGPVQAQLLPHMALVMTRKRAS